MLAAEEAISTVVSPPKGKKNPSQVDKTAESDKVKIEADWIESAHKTLFNDEEIIKAFFKEKVCNSGALLKPLDNILRQKCFSYGAGKPGHQSWKDQNLFVKHIQSLIF